MYYSFNPNNKLTLLIILYTRKLEIPELVGSAIYNSLSSYDYCPMKECLNSGLDQEPGFVVNSLAVKPLTWRHKIVNSIPGIA